MKINAARTRRNIKDAMSSPPVQGVTIIVSVFSVLALVLFGIDREQQQQWREQREANLSCVELSSREIQEGLASIEGETLREMVQVEYDALIARASDRAAFWGGPGEKNPETIATADYCQEIQDFRDSVHQTAQDEKTNG